jgi:hypothetical protein
MKKWGDRIGDLGGMITQLKTEIHPLPRYVCLAASAVGINPCKATAFIFGSRKVHLLGNKGRTSTVWQIVCRN